MISVNELSDAMGISAVRLKQIIKERELPIERKTKNGKISIPNETAGRLLEEKGLAPKSEIMTYFNLKGGVGKTTLNYSMACFLAERFPSDKPVVLIDLDGEACATNLLIKENQNLEDMVTIYEVLKHDLKIKDHLVETKYPNLYLLPARMKALRAERLISGQRNPKNLLKSHMQGMEDFGAIVFDMPPTLNTLTISALLTVDKLVVPVNADLFSLESLFLMMDEMQDLVKEWDAKMPELKVVFNKFQSNTIASTEIYKEIIQNFSNELIPVQIKYSAQINNSINDGLPINEGPSKEIRNSFNEVASIVSEIRGKMH